MDRLRCAHFALDDCRRLETDSQIAYTKALDNSYNHSSTLNKPFNKNAAIRVIPLSQEDTRPSLNSGTERPKRTTNRATKKFQNKKQIQQ